MPEIPIFKKLVKFTISMMMNVKSIGKCEIYLFNSDTGYKSNPLKQFVYYLRYQGKRGQINFSLSSGENSLHLGLSIGENFTLDSISKSLVQNSEEHLNKKLLSIENEYTVKLIKLLPNMDCKLEELSQETIALISIVKSLLARTEYLFLVEENRFFDSQTSQLIKKAIETEATIFGRKVLIRSTSAGSWIDIATDIIIKESSGEFTRQENPLCGLKKSPSHHFTLIKKAS